MIRTKGLFLLIIGIGCYSLPTHSQIHEEYIGKDHHEGVIVNTSDNHQYWGWGAVASGDNTLNGNGLDGAKIDAARFLSQATFGGRMSDIEALAGQDYEAWIDAQVGVPASNYLEMYYQLDNDAFQYHLAAGNDSADYNSMRTRHFRYAWWRNTMNGEDLLRQRMAYALSQILVISIDNVLDDHLYGVAHYYDLLMDNAFGNYEDLLLDVSLHPAMSSYLTYFNNPKTIDSLNIQPDENYAREVMQLFSIGVHQLNNDGTIIYNSDGIPLPTYDNSTITELAKVFTGLSAGAVVDNSFITDPYFGVDVALTDWTTPLAMYEEWHEQGEKTLLNAYVIPAGQTGMEDVEDGINHLFNHPNVGPFLGRRLIQHFVKSNPSPDYIDRVADAFNDNGNGVRGDLLATLKAVLLDEEARSCDWIENPNQGKLREPIVRYTQFARVNNNLLPSDEYWNNGNSFFNNTGQAPLNAPSVFNFFQPDFVPGGLLADEGLYGPEFQIHDSRTSIHMLNFQYSWSHGSQMMQNQDDAPIVTIDLLEYAALARDPNVLMDHLDVRFCNGQLSLSTREIIIDVLNGMQTNQFGNILMIQRARIAIYLMMMSPDYAILK